MTTPTQRDYPDDSDTGAMQRDQIGQEMAGPQDQTGLAGSAQSPANSGLAGTPNSPDNSGLAGSSGAPISDAGLEGGATYGNDTDYTGVVGAGTGADTSFTGDYGTSVGGPGLSGQTRTPESELLDPGYNPQVGDAGRLNDLNRVGQPGAPNYDPNQRPTPSGYSGAAGSPGIPDQAGTQDQTTYTNQSGATSGQGDGSANT